MERPSLVGNRRRARRCTQDSVGIDDLRRDYERRLEVAYVNQVELTPGAREMIQWLMQRRIPVLVVTSPDPARDPCALSPRHSSLARRGDRRREGRAREAPARSVPKRCGNST